MNVFNVNLNCAPVGGNVEKVRYFSGKFINAGLDKASIEIERIVLTIKTLSRQLVTGVRVAGLIAGEILCHVKPGELLKNGQRCGFTRFGSRVDIYPLLTVMAKVAVGDKVSATETILAE